MKEGIKKELGTGRVAFLARLEEIKKEAETGRTVMSIYREFGAKVGIGYSQFDRYVIKYITGDKNGNTERKSVSASKKKPQVRTRSAGEPAFVSSDEPRSKDELA